MAKSIPESQRGHSDRAEFSALCLLCLLFRANSIPEHSSEELLNLAKVSALWLLRLLGLLFQILQVGVALGAAGTEDNLHLILAFIFAQQRLGFVSCILLAHRLAALVNDHDVLLEPVPERFYLDDSILVLVDHLAGFLLVILVLVSQQSGMLVLDV